jgi:peptidoglycan/xylan/chitin deacetylase (PgdA/CDA1 family)
VTTKSYEVPPWIHIPLDAFEKQISYLSRRYTVITLHDAIDSLRRKDNSQKNLAVITFDDGYRNNLTVVQPVLEKYRVPATIFLTTSYIDTDNFLPLDRAYLLITSSKGRQPVFPSIQGLGLLSFSTNEEIFNSYQTTVNFLKKFPVKKQEEYLAILENLLEINYEKISNDITEDFILLSWMEINKLLETGLFSFGAHTATHEILTNVSFDESSKQITDSKSAIENNIKQDINLFAYPNGSAADYNDAHVHYLKENGFTGSVTTTPKLNTIHTDPFRLGRICIGPELSANFNHFSLKISGLINSVKSKLPSHCSEVY